MYTGSQVVGGSEVNQPIGHYTKGNKPAGFDVDQIFVSPSIKYSGCEVYAKATKYVNWKLLVLTLHVTYVLNSFTGDLSITVRGKILEGENFGEFGERLAIRQNFPHQYL